MNIKKWKILSMSLNTKCQPSLFNLMPHVNFEFITNFHIFLKALDNTVELKWTLFKSISFKMSFLLGMW